MLATLTRIVLSYLLATTGCSAWDKTDPTRHASWKLFDHELCGLSQADRIIGGTIASMGSYPWIVRLGYYKSNRPAPIFRCGGAVITNHYVMTAAHCAYNLPSNLKLGLVRIGEHDATTNPDCEDDSCAEPVQDYYPDEIVIHEDYSSKTFKNDLCLIRTDRRIEFSSYVRPICMISESLLSKKFVGETCEVAGWGIYDIEVEKGSNLLQTIKLAVVENDDCAIGFKNQAHIGSTQMCVGGVVGKDSCSGDSGGPLMKVDVVGNGPPRYYILGVVSFGAKRCGATTLPGVYTRLADYVGWMLDHMHS